LGVVYVEADLVGTFSPDTVGTTGDVYLDADDVGDFTLAASGYVFVGALPVGTYTAVAAYPPTIPEDARYRTKLYLDTYLDNSKLTKDDNATEVVFAVMYTYPNYPLIREFFAEESPVDLLFLIGKPTSEALMQADQTPRGYHERVPIAISTIDKTGITAEKLIWKGEAELRSVCETYPTGSQRKLTATTERTQRLGSTIIVQTEYMLDYVRDTIV